MDSRRGSSQASDSKTAYDSSTFDKDVQIKLDETVGSASISPSGRDVVLASREGLHIIDLDSPYSQPRYVAHRSPWEVADVQWSPFASRDSWIVSTSNQKALVWNLNLSTPSAPIEHTLHAHSNAITDINFSAHHADILATCAVDSYVHCWDLRKPAKPVISFAEWFSGATQVKWNRQDSHIIASSHQRKLLIWDDRKGAYPLKEIEAHSTQIYGIDWNRLRPEAVLTCSLDRTIKLWDYTSEGNTPERVIRTPYPVWRARHTPFGWGILAMPKRHDFNLHLYDRRLDANKPRGTDLPSVHSFGGHTDQVKEFLWRSRGGIQDGADKREFQLVSWGTDRVLRLHKIEDEHLEAVGHHRGAEVHNRLHLTRAGAAYRSFRDELPATENANLPRTLKPPRASGLLGWSLTQKSASQNSTSTAAPAGMQARRRTRKAGNAIDWMGGVKMGKDAEGGLLGLTPRPSIRPTDHQVIWDTPDSLSDEITYVGKKFKKVNFEHVDINKRLATVTLNGPWGVEGASVFVRVTLKFPSAYPVHAVPQYIFEKTTSAVTDPAMIKIRHDLRTIAEYFGMRRIGSLEAIIMYLLGERDLDESLKVFPDPTVAEDSSSEDDDDEEAGRLDMSGSLGSALVNASVPLPKACGAYFADDGRLVCFFPPKPEPKPLFDLAPLRAEEKPKGHRLFDELGRWRAESPEPKDTSSEADATEEEDDSSEMLSSSSASSSSDTSDIISDLTSRFKPLAAWGGASIRLPKTSQHSSSGQLPAPRPAPVPKSYISIVDTREYVPSKKNLAEEYQIFGDGPDVCLNNAAAAAQHDLPELAQVWELLRMILFNQVPLDILPPSPSRDLVLVVAHRATTFRKNREADANTATDGLHARVKWGGHPLASKWLIPRLFEHFERLADVQMLAMMSCVLAEPLVRQSQTATLKRLRQQDLSMPMQCPAFSLDYLPSHDVAMAMFRARMGSTILNKQDLPTFSLIDTGEARFGSGESSNGAWGSDRFSFADINAPYSAQSTPPKLNRASTATARFNYPQSLSTSPEKLALRRASANPFAGALVLPKPYANTAAGTPPEVRFSNDEADLSTSAPASAVTWGGTTVFTTGGMSPESQRKGRNSFTIDGSGRGSDAQGSYEILSDEESDMSSDEDDAAFDSRSFVSRRSNVAPSNGAAHLAKTATVRLTLKNQDLFDNEAHSSVPLLDPTEADRYATYRTQYAEQLAIWGLAVQHSEVLKFNDLVNVALEQPQRTSSGLGAAVSGSSGMHSRNGSNGTQRSGKAGLAGAPSGTQRHSRKHVGENAVSTNCRICWQVIVGLHVRCTSCQTGRAHRSCVDEWVEAFGEGEPWCEKLE